MKFTQVAPNKFKRVNTIGSNQHKKKRRVTLGGLCSSFILLVLAAKLAGLGFDYTVNAFTTSPTKIISPLPTNEVTIVTPVPTKVESFMKNQNEINQNVVKWMRLQEIHNEAVALKLEVQKK